MERTAQAIGAGRLPRDRDRLVLPALHNDVDWQLVVNECPVNPLLCMVE